MANIRLIRRRIRSIQNTAKITRAMEMVAASKMRKAQERGLAGRPYSDKMREVIGDLTRATKASGVSAPHPLLDTRDEVKNIALLFISTDRGMCGGMVSNLNRKAGNFFLENKQPVQSIAVGRKSVDFLRRASRNITAEFTNLGDRPAFIETCDFPRHS